VSGVFGEPYAAAYDRVYADKDYAGECDTLEALFRLHASAPVRRLLDLGCGTGNHSLALAGRGYEVVGVDRSSAMLARARDKARTAGEGRAAFVLGDIRRLPLRNRFDAALMLFAVLGYQREDEDVRAALGEARRCLRAGGLLVLDVWHGPAVLRLGPAARARTIETPEGPLLRRARGELDGARRLCRVVIELVAADRAPGREVRETHEMRYFFPDELGERLRWSGFELLRTAAAPGIDRAPRDQDWNMLVVARAV
jgi:SAM-dependent methyltransferase